MTIPAPETGRAQDGPSESNSAASTPADWIDVTIPARDGYELAGHVMTGGNAAGPVVLLNSATAVPQQFYRNFAEHLVEAGASAAITYDYRGIGLSAPERLRGFPARMRDWALLDMAAAVDWVAAEFPGRRLVGTGHSFGGQGLGLIENANRFERFAAIAAMVGYFGYLNTPVSALLQMNLLGRPLSAVMGYMPGGLIGSGPPMPRHVYREWANWCLRRGYFFADPTLDAETKFRTYRNPLMSIRIADDVWGTERAVGALVGRFVNADVEHHVFGPGDSDGGGIGHMGFFSRRHRETLWPKVTNWLLSDA